MTTSPNGPSGKSPSKAKREGRGPARQLCAAWGGPRPRRAAERRGSRPSPGSAPPPHVPGPGSPPTPPAHRPRLPSPTTGFLAWQPTKPLPRLPGSPARLPRPAPGPGSRQTPKDSGRHSQLLVEPGLAAGLEVTDNDAELPDVLHKLLQVFLQVVELLRHGLQQTPPREWSCSAASCFRPGPPPLPFPLAAGGGAWGAGLGRGLGAGRGGPVGAWSARWTGVWGGA